MKIAFACDHAGVCLKSAIIETITELGHEAVDLSPDDAAQADYPVSGSRAAAAVRDGLCELGIVACGTGAGIAMAAGKLAGIRCVNCSDTYTARMSRAHNNANMLALGGRVLGAELCKDIVRVWLTTNFDGGRHARRVDMIDRLGRGETLE